MLLADNCEQIQKFGVSSLRLFGSFVRDRDIHVNSDIDFLVEFFPENFNFRNFMDLGYFLEDITGRKVELIEPESLSKFIGPHILKEVEDAQLAKRPGTSQTFRRSA